MSDPFYPESKDAAILAAFQRAHEAVWTATLPALVCSWCGVTMRNGPEPVSHGICTRCMERLTR